MKRFRDRLDNRYIKISKSSGCISANYHIINDQDSDIMLVTADVTESSGSFYDPTKRRA